MPTCCNERAIFLIITTFSRQSSFTRTAKTAGVVFFYKTRYGYNILVVTVAGFARIYNIAPKTLFKTTWQKLNCCSFFVFTEKVQHLLLSRNSTVIGLQRCDLSLLFLWSHPHFQDLILTDSSDLHTHFLRQGSGYGKSQPGGLSGGVNRVEAIKQALCL